MVHSQAFSRGILFMLLAYCLCQGSYAQVHTVVLNQQPQMSIQAGEDVSIISGERVRLGGNPTASAGYGNYIYLWEPALGLDDPTSSNPMASPTTSTNYVITTIDGNNCQQVDEVFVEVRANSRLDLELNNQTLLFPNPTQGLIHIELTHPELVDQIVVTSVLGQKNQIINPEDFIWGKIDLDLRPFGKGLYLITIRQKNKTEFKRVLVN